MEAEERRLLEFDGQPLAKRVVKHRIARLVFEIREHYGILVGEFRSAMKIGVCRCENANIAAAAETCLPRGMPGRDPSSSRRDPAADSHLRPGLLPNTGL